MRLLEGRQFMFNPNTVFLFFNSQIYDDDISITIFDPNIHIYAKRMNYSIFAHAPCILKVNNK